MKISKLSFLLIVFLPLITGLACLQPGSAYVPPASTAAPADPTPKAPAAAAIVAATPKPLAIDGKITMCAVVIADEALHLRIEPKETATVLGYLSHGDQVRVIKFLDDSHFPDVSELPWWLVQTKDGIQGYARATYLQKGSCK